MKKNLIALFFIASCMINAINASIKLTIVNEYKDKDIEVLIENSDLGIEKITKTINSNDSIVMDLEPKALKNLSSSMWIKTKYDLHWHKGIQNHLDKIFKFTQSYPGLTATIKINSGNIFHYGYSTTVRDSTGKFSMSFNT